MKRAPFVPAGSRAAGSGGRTWQAPGRSSKEERGSGLWVANLTLSKALFGIIDEWIWPADVDQGSLVQHPKCPAAHFDPVRREYGEVPRQVFGGHAQPRCQRALVEGEREPPGVAQLRIGAHEPVGESPYARRYALFTLVGIAGEDDLIAGEVHAGIRAGNRRVVPFGYFSELNSCQRLGRKLQGCGYARNVVGGNVCT